MKRFIFAAIILLMSCRGSFSPDSGAGSSLNQLVEDEFQCKVWDAPRIEVVKAKAEAYSKEYNNNGSQYSQKYFNSLAGIPDKYLDWMSTRVASDGFRIYTSFSSQGKSFTEWGSGRDRISVDRSDWGFDYSLQHEVGHYVELYASDAGAQQRGYSEQQFYSELKQVANAAYSNPKLNWYPKSYYFKDRNGYYAEFWAEAFNSYYCSEEANQNFSQVFPEVYAFVSKYLEPPVWNQGGQNYAPPTSISMLVYTDKRTPQVVSAYFAGPKTMTGLSVCYETKEACETNSASFAAVPLAEQQTNYASFFTLRDLGLNANTKFLYLRGINQQKQVVLTRLLDLTQKP